MAAGIEPQYGLHYAQFKFSARIVLGGLDSSSTPKTVSEIAARPLLKFCVFNGVSAAMFGAGFYTERYWKIHTTSRGLLIIAILLVPLNFLAIAAFTDKSPPTDLLALGGEAVSLALFTALVYAAGWQRSAGIKETRRRYGVTATTPPSYHRY